jgi:cytochrome c5
MRRGPALALLAACLALPAFAHAPVTTTVQFDREVVRILDDHCVMCHSDEASAFPLITYEQTYAARWKIRQDVLDRHMTPWAAVPGYGEFANSNGLTQREIDFLVSWAESYGPRNNGAVYTGTAATTSVPALVRAHFDFDRWVLGNPDLRVTVRASAQRVILDPGLTADRWVRGVEYKPGNHRSVHFVSFIIEETRQWIGSWTPWYGFVSLPAGLAWKLPARSHIVAEIHYQGSTTPTIDQDSMLGLYFAAQPPQQEVTSLTVAPKASASGKLIATLTLDADTKILAIQPDILPGIRSIEVTARAPNGTTRVLLFARDIQAEWPTPYILARPVSLPKGTELSVTEHYPGASSTSADAPVVFSVAAGSVPRIHQQPIVR